MDGYILQNDRMGKKSSRQILADNLDRLMGDSPGLSSNNALGLKAKVAHSHIRRIRLQESAATVDMLDSIAAAFGIQPWELLADGEEVRAEALSKMMFGRAVSNEKVERHLPPAPQKEVEAPRLKKKDRGGEKPAH